MFTPRRQDRTPRTYRASPYQSPMRSPRHPGHASPGGFRAYPRLASSTATPLKRYGDIPSTPSPRPLGFVPRAPHRIGPDSPPLRRRGLRTPKARVVSSPAKLSDAPAFDDLATEVQKAASRVKTPFPDEEGIFLQQFSRLRVNREFLSALAKQRARSENAEAVLEAPDNGIPLQEAASRKEEERKRRRAEADAEARRREMEEKRLKEEAEKRQQEAEAERARQAEKEWREEMARLEERARQRDRAQEERRREIEHLEHLSRLKREEAAKEKARQEAAALEAKLQQEAREMEEMKARQEAARLQEELDAKLREERQAAEPARVLKRETEQAEAHAAFLATMEALKQEADQKRAEIARQMEEDARRLAEIEEEISKQQALLQEQARAQAEEILRQAYMKAEKEAEKKAQELRLKAEQEAYKHIYGASAAAFAKVQAEYQQGHDFQQYKAPQPQPAPATGPHTHSQQPQPQYAGYSPRYQPQQVQPDPQSYKHYRQGQSGPHVHAHGQQERTHCEDYNDVPMRGPSIYFDKDASMASIPADEPRRSPSPMASSPPPRPSTPAEWFFFYETRWEELKNGIFPWNLRFEYIPWPVLHEVSCPQDITTRSLKEFFTHADRPACFRGSRRDIGRAELLKWHPDKFMSRVQGGVDHDVQELGPIHEAVKVVARFLIQLKQS